MTKYYQVKQSNFLWKQGAIISDGRSCNNGYAPIEDIWDTTPVNQGEYISRHIVEHPDNEEYFTRVYPDTIAGKLFKTKDQLTAMYSKSFNPSQKEL